MIRKIPSNKRIKKTETQIKGKETKTQRKKENKTKKTKRTKKTKMTKKTKKTASHKSNSIKVSFLINQPGDQTSLLV